MIWRMGLVGGELPEAHRCSRSLTVAAEQPQMSLFVKKNKEMGKKVHQHGPKVSANASGRVYEISYAVQVLSSSK